MERGYDAGEKACNRRLLECSTEARGRGAESCGGCSRLRGGAERLVHLFVREDVLDVVDVVEIVVEFYEGFREDEVGDGDGREGDVGDFGAVGLEVFLLQSVGDPVEAVDATADFVALLTGEDVVGAGGEGDFDEGVFGDLVLRDEELTGVKKLKRHGT